MKGFWIAVIVAVACLVVGMLLLGLPGAAIFVASTPLLQLLFGANALDRLPADSYWPIGIMITLLWPPSIVVGYLLAYRALAAAARGWQHAGFVATLAAWGLALSIVMFLIGRQA